MIGVNQGSQRGNGNVGKKPSTARAPFFLGVDIGGTKVAAGIVSATGEILCKTRVPMQSGEDEAGGLRAVCQAMNAALAKNPCERSSIAAIGVSSPGPLDPRAGIVINPPNLPCWRNFSLRKELEKEFDVPVKLDNDANAAALAEALWGAGRGYASVFYATLGTGIGAGLILDGRVYHGHTGAAVEGGHVSIDYRGPKCACGKRGCIEALASGPSLARRAREKLADGSAAKSAEKLFVLAGGDPQKITAEMIGEAWRAGDSFCKTLLEETACLLSIWLGTIVDLFEPDVMIFGGGMSEMMAAWFEEIRRELPRWSINSRCQEIPLVRAQYGEDAGIAGGAALCASEAKLKATVRTHTSRNSRRQRKR